MLSDYELCTCPDCTCETRGECRATCGINNQCSCCDDEIPSTKEYEDRL